MTTDPGLAHRRGPRPRTTDTNPHSQLDQQPTDPAIRQRLAARMFALPGVTEQPSRISLPGARALWLEDPPPSAPPEAFMVEAEFAHLHPPPDFSLHVALPPDVASAAVEVGWGEVHPMAARGILAPSVLMIYAPRDDDELDTVAQLVEAAWKHATAS
ncbi:MAG: DUF5519 family protein [Actinomycetota bacterium]|nr:DUF5519 family protein [Actinomycetota bacterium]